MENRRDLEKALYKAVNEIRLNRLKLFIKSILCAIYLEPKSNSHAISERHESIFGFSQEADKASHFVS